MAQQTSDKKRIIFPIAVVLLVFFIISTFSSKTIYNMMLPKVSVQRVSSGTVTDTYSYTGSFTYTNTQTETAKDNWLLKEVSVGIGDEVEEGDTLFSIDMTDADLQREQLVINVDTAQKALDAQPGNAQAKLNLKKAKRALQLHDSAYPKDGKITAQKAGRINEINYKSGNTAAAGSVICVLQTKDSRPVANWSVSYDEGKNYEMGQKIKISFIAKDGNDSDKVQQTDAEITDKVYDSTAMSWRFSSKMAYAGKIPLYSEPTVLFQNDEKVYPCVVPIGALNEMGADTYSIYTVEERDGIFGKEYYLKQHEVSLLARNNISAAVGGDIPERSRVVVYSSKAVADGSTVEIE